MIREKLDVKSDPQRGDLVINARADKHKTRWVSDRYIGGDIDYMWVSGSQYHDRCTLQEWEEFCGVGARFVEIAVSSRSR